MLDKINCDMGTHTLFYATQGIKRAWHMRAEQKSRRYPTCWEELAEVIA